MVLPGEVRRREDLALAKIARAQRLAALYDLSMHPDDRAQLLAADRLLCYSDPCYFIDSWGWVRAEKEDADPDLVDVPFILWPKQVELSQWLDERVRCGDVALMPKGREKGFTWMVIWKRLHAWLFPGFTSVLISKKEETVDKKHSMSSLFGKLRYGIAHLPPHLWPSWPPRYIDHHLLLKNLHNRGEITGESTNSDAARGDRKQVAVYDEFRRVDAALAEEMWRASESVARSRWVIYNPDGKAHQTYKLYSSLSPEQVFKVRWTFDPYRDEEWKRSKIFPIGALTDDEFNVEYDGSHESVGGFRIWSFNEQEIRYNDSSPDWRLIMAQARRTWDAPGGWDFGSGFSLLVCLMGLVDWTADPRKFVIRVDDERVWSQEHWEDAAGEVVEALSQYGGHKVHYADPNGIQRESDQTSWISKLQSGRVPVWPLPAAADNDQSKLWRRKHVQLLLRQNRLLVHDRCGVLREAMKEWKLDVPQGVSDLSFLNKRFVKPRKDAYSHPCETLMYLVDGVMMESRRRIAALTHRNIGPLQGQGSVETWIKMYSSAVLGEDED